MKRITVKLPDDLDAKLRHEATRRGGGSMLSIIRTVISAEPTTNQNWQ